MTRYVLGNWKSNGSRSFVHALIPQVSEIVAGDVQVGCAPPSPYLESARTILGQSPTWLGAQTCSATASGAFTGEVTAEMVAETCDFVIIGHSERRSLFQENDSVVRAKLDRVLQTNLVAVLCVGEVLQERQAGLAASVVRRQLESAFIDQRDIPDGRLVIAYEPVWAIGTGVAATVDDASAMCCFIHDWLRSSHNLDRPVLYGGSVNPGNASELIAAPGVDGFLVGGASLKVEDFGAIVQAARET